MIYMYICKSRSDNRHGVLVLSHKPIQDLLMSVPVVGSISRPLRLAPDNSLIIAPSGKSEPAIEFRCLDSVSRIDFSDRKSSRAIIDEARRMLRHNVREGHSTLSVESLVYEPENLPDRPYRTFRAQTCLGEFVAEVR